MSCRTRRATASTKRESSSGAATSLVVRIPWDPALEAGAEASIEDLAHATRRAYLELAAAVADGFHVDQADARASAQ